MADNCKICNKIITHTQYNSSRGMCSKCYDNPYRDLDNKEQEDWISKGSDYN